jgi:hypothetical protein
MLDGHSPIGAPQSPFWFHRAPSLGFALICSVCQHWHCYNRFDSIPWPCAQLHYQITLPLRREKVPLTSLILFLVWTLPLPYSLQRHPSCPSARSPLPIPLPSSLIVLGPTTFVMNWIWLAKSSKGRFQSHVTRLLRKSLTPTGSKLSQLRAQNCIRRHPDGSDVAGDRNCSCAAA